jgi:hypothetical protein
MQSFLESVKPIAHIGTLLGTQYQNAALRVVPPISAAFSRMIASLPSQRENKAVERPPAPLPTTTTSTSTSKALGRAGDADRRFGPAWEEDMQTSALCAQARKRTSALRRPPDFVAPSPAANHSATRLIVSCYRRAAPASYKK